MFHHDAFITVLMGIEQQIHAERRPEDILRDRQARLAAAAAAEQRESY